MTNDPTSLYVQVLTYSKREREKERFVARFRVSSESAAETSRDVIKLSLSMSQRRLGVEKGEIKFRIFG